MSCAAPRRAMVELELARGCGCTCIAPGRTITAHPPSAHPPPAPPPPSGAAAPGGAARSGMRAACAAAGTASRRVTTMTASRCPSTGPSGRPSRPPSGRGARPPGPADSLHRLLHPALLILVDKRAPCAPASWPCCSCDLHEQARLQRQCSSGELEERVVKSRAGGGSVGNTVKRMGHTVESLVMWGGSTPKRCCPLS